MEIVNVDINELVSPSYNPRDIKPYEMEKLKTSIEEFGYVDPIVVNDVNNHIVGGNQRFEALKELGYTTVDVVYIHESDLNREKSLNIALNKISGDWDTVKLNHIFEELKLEGFDKIELTGFDEIDIEKLSAGDLVLDDDILSDDMSNDFDNHVLIIKCPHCSREFEYQQ